MIKKTLPILSIIFVIGVYFSAQAAKNLPQLDKSPADIAIFPKKGQDKLIRVVYSRPQAKGRKIFGELVKYGNVWRTGANESSEITFYRDAMINGKKIDKGTYSLFTIPNKNSWTIIINKDLNQWGAYSYKKESDVLRTDVKANSRKDNVEAFTIDLMEKKAKEKAHLIFAWEKTQVEVPITF